MDTPNYDMSDNQKKFVRAARRQGLTVDYGYSGRGMYNRRCPSVVVPRPNDFRTRAHVCLDNMGLQFVVYAAS
jgi:hypothetical protein